MKNLNFVVFFMLIAIFMTGSIYAVTSGTIYFKDGSKMSFYDFLEWTNFYESKQFQLDQWPRWEESSPIKIDIDKVSEVDVLTGEISEGNPGSYYIRGVLFQIKTIDNEVFTSKRRPQNPNSSNYSGPGGQLIESLRLYLTQNDANNKKETEIYYTKFGDWARKGKFIDRIVFHH